MKNYKLHIYYKTTTRGHLKGNIERKEYFDSLKELDQRYRELFVYNDFALNPTAWESNDNGETWTRLLDY